MKKTHFISVPLLVQSRLWTIALTAAVALFVSSSIARAEDESKAPPPPSWDMLAFEVKRWRKIQTRWQFTPQYGGVWVEVSPKADAEAPTETHAFHTLAQDPARFLKLADIVAKLPPVAPDSEACANMMNDAPYGTIRMTKGATTTEIRWNSGCMDQDYASFMGVLREADTLVSGWGKANPADRTEDFLVQ